MRLLRLLPFLLPILLAVPLPAQEVEDCLFCHEDAELTGERDGREISAFVDAAGFAGTGAGSGHFPSPRRGTTSLLRAAAAAAPALVRGQP